MQYRRRSLTLKSWFYVGSITLCCLVPLKAKAQISPDGTVPTGINQSGTVFNITGGTQAGGNLFHSFKEFSVPTGSTAYFQNSLQIQNIFSRVTGTSVSNIDGVIKANGTANLFLLNPRGIIFGPSSHLDIGGSFLATTADAFVFNNGLEFSATNPQAPPLLTVNIPIGLRFRDNPGSIVNQSVVGLQVPLGKTLALVGSNVNLKGGILTAPSGRIELGSVAGNNLVNLTSTDTGFSLGYQGVQAFQDIQLSGQSLVSASGEGGGNIQVQGRRITLTGGSQIAANTLGSQAGGTLAVNAAESVELSGISPDGKSSSTLGVGTNGSGNAGNVTIKTGRLILKDGAGVLAGTLSTGKAGNINVTAQDSVELSGIGPDSLSGGQKSSQIGVVTTGSGDAGNVMIDTGQLILLDGAQVGASTLGTGKAGNVNVTAQNSVELGGNGPINLFGQEGYSQIAAITFLDTGDAGNVTIKTGRLMLRDGAFVSSATLFGRGNAGNVNVTASDVEVIGRSRDGQSPSRITTQTSDSTGNAGNVTIDTGRLSILDGAEVQAGTIGIQALARGNAGNVSVTAKDAVELSGSSLLAAGTTSSTGNAGNVTIQTGRLLLRDSAKIGAITGSSTGNAGDVSVTAKDLVELSGSSLLAAGTTSSTGNAGKVTIQTGRLLLRDSAQIGAITALSTGNAGDVSVTAKDAVELSGSSMLAADTLLSTGDAGKVTIQTGRLVLRDGAQVTVGTALSTGKAGDIGVTAKDAVELSGSSRLTAGTIFSTGDGGNVIVATRKLIVRDGAQVNVNGKGLGNPGSIYVTAQNLRLDNQGLLTAASDTGKGGNIRLQVRDILLRHQSTISAAGSATNATTEGNIGINAETLVLLERSRIITSATDPIGGSNIKISPLNGSDLVVFKSPDSVINAAGNLAIDTQIQLTPSDVPQVAVADPNEQIANNPCTKGKGSEFTITGRGGLPPNPNEPLNSDVVGVGLVAPALKGAGEAGGVRKQISLPSPVVPAQGWVFNDQGQVVLTAYNPAVTQPQRPWRNPGACHPL